MPEQRNLNDKSISIQAANAEEQQHFTFDKSFQEKIVHAMLIDRKWALQFSEVLDINYFQYAHLKLVSDQYISYYKEYKEFPSLELLLTMIRTELKNANDSVLRDRVKEFFFRVESEKDLSDLGYVKDKSLDFCKKAALQKALEKSIDYIKTEKYEKVMEVVKDALSAGNEHSEGLDLAEDIEARYSDTYRRTIPTGVEELDQKTILRGGLGGGELGIIVAPTGVGKSHLLVHFGANAVRSGKNVVHYTFELNERMVGIRYDSHLVDIPSIECYNQQDAIKEYYKEHKEVFGQLRIKYFPTGQASCQTLRTHIDKLSAKKFIPDMITVDYAGIMRSADRNDLLRLELKKVCEELRQLAEELDCPIWTAIQSNKEGADSEVVDLTNMSESYGQAHVADFVLGLSRHSAQKATGFGNIFIAKNRAGIDGIKYLVHLDTAKSKLKVLSDDEAANMREKEQTDEDHLNLIRKRFLDSQANK